MSENVPSRPLAIVLPYAWVILWVVYFASVAAPLNQFKIPPVMPVLMQTLQIDLAQAGALMSVIALVGLILALPAGVILQRWGPRLTGLLALGCMAAGASVGALSNDYGALLTSRVIEGIGIGLIGVVAPATIAMWFPPERQGGPMGIWATWVPVGTVVMYLLAPALAAWQGLPAVWWFGAGFAVLMFAAYAVLVRRPPAQQASGRSAPEPLDLRSALANRNIWLLALEFGCFNLALVSLGTYYPTFLNEVRGFALGQAAFVASIGTMIVLFSAPLAGWFSDRIGSRRLVFSLPFLALAALLVFPFRVEGGAIVAVMIAQGLIAGAVPTATFAAAPEVMRRPQWAGLGLAVVLIGQNLGQLVGPVLFGRLVDSLGWIPAGNLLIGVCLVGFVSAWLVKMR